MAAPGKMAETTSKWLDAVLGRGNRVGNLLKRQIAQLAESPSARGSASGSAAGEPMADEEPWPPMDEETEEVDVEVAEDEETQELRAHGLKGVPLSEWLQGVEGGEDVYDERHPPARRARPSPARPSAAHGFGPGENPPPPPPWPPANSEPMAEEEEPVAEEPVADEVPEAQPRQWPDEPEPFEGMPELIDELPSCAEWAFTHDQHTEHAHQYSVAMMVDEPKAWPACHNKKEPLGCNGCLCYYTISEVVGL
jgi:hypothetical protein